MTSAGAPLFWYAATNWSAIWLTRTTCSRPGEKFTAARMPASVAARPSIANTTAIITMRPNGSPRWTRGCTISEGNATATMSAMTYA